MRLRRFREALCVLGVGALLAGCAPTYRPDQLLTAIEGICEREHHFHVKAKQIGRTIAIQFNHPDILKRDGEQFTLSDSANEILGNLIEAIHRVCLSSSASVDFYVVLVSDPAAPGIYLTVIRCMEDVRRANANMLPPTEFFLRTILDLKYVGVPSMNFDQVILNDIKLEQFLSWQLAKRIQTRIAEGLQRKGITTAEVGPCAGEFHNGEFAFTLNVTSKPNAKADQALVQGIFQEATDVVAQVLSGYQFQNFQAVRLIHPETGRSLLLPKTRLELFR